MKHILFLCSILITITIYAQPGTVDKTYGTDNTGTVTVLNPVEVTSAAVQPDDKLVLNLSPTTTEYIFIRHNKDGSVDSSFGNKGQTVITVNDLLPGITGGGLRASAVQPDGKIVATGGIAAGLLDGSVLVVRLLPDGTPDESFGSHGRVITGFDYPTGSTAIAVQPDGKILVAGLQQRDIFNIKGDILIRYNPDGTLDKTFGKYGGYTSYDDFGGSVDYALLLQPDGKILTGGSSAGKFLVVRFLSDGTLDKSFGTDGAVTTRFTSMNDRAYSNSLALDEKNRIVAEGVVGESEKTGVVRYLPDGAPDNSFGEGGTVELTFDDFPHLSVTGKKVFSEPDGKLLIHSVIVKQNGDLLQTALSGLNEDGSPDASFGTGEGQTIFNSAYVYSPLGAVMQSDGKLVVAGNKIDKNENYIGYALTRFNGYPQKAPLAVRVKRWLQNHGISWKGLPAEDKIAYYTVEQSADNKVFVPINKVSGIASLKNYSVTNSHLLTGANYYRIKAVSSDGAIYYSEVVSADNMANTASVFPNPARSYITVQGLQSNEAANISIKDGSGTVLARGVSSGSTQYRSQVSSLQPGTYYLNITTNGKTETLRFVKE